jgi:hypothetical protein
MDAVLTLSLALHEDLTLAVLAELSHATARLESPTPASTAARPKAATVPNIMLLRLIF